MITWTRVSIGLAGAALLLVACTSTAQPSECQLRPGVDTTSTNTDEASALFGFPLDNVVNAPHHARFQEHYGSYPDLEYHAAEDYHAPAGTPVYAMADGDVSFSGPMGGYGWLVIVDHPWGNLYSLYGHLSPSRWQIDGGAVEKGDLLGYLGDGWENGGSRERPLQTHLHLGVRAGQRTDYPGRGEWRWMAGWIKPCPSDLGWFQPSELIAAQTVPEGGFAVPESGLFERWGVELLILAATLGGVLWWTIVGVRRRSWIVPLTVSGVAVIASLYFSHRGFILAPHGFRVAAVMGAIVAGVIAYRRGRVALVRRT